VDCLKFLLEDDNGKKALESATRLVRDTEIKENESKIALLVSKKTGISLKDAARAVELVLLRVRSEKKMAPMLDPSGMAFDREGLEMASNPIVSEYRARSFKGFDTVLDLCSGIGIDSIILATHGSTGRKVVGADLSPERCFMAHWNSRHYGVKIPEDAIEFVRADALDDSFLSGVSADAVFADPGRRHSGGGGGLRTSRLSETHPPTDVLVRKIMDKVSANLCIKSAPGISRDEPLLSECVSEFVSLNGELLECVLWFGEFVNLKKQEPSGRIATALPGEGTISSLDESSDAVSESIGGFILEPDPAVIRAGLVQQLAARTNASRIDEKIAYLTCEKELIGEQQSTSGLFKSFRVIDDFPFSLARIKEKVREIGPKTVVVKKRGSAVEVDAFRKKIMTAIKPAREGPAELIVFLTRKAGKPWAAVAERARGD